MTTQNDNPFVLPGLGQSGELGQNPLMASMEMMRQAWQGMAGSSAGQSPMAAPMTLEDMDRRLADLRTVENWLRMNLSMLSSSIQGLEVQRATVATLKSFMDMSSTTASPDADQASTPPAAQAWWNMLQQQFDTLAAATTATMQGAEAVKSKASNAAAGKKAPRKRTAAAAKKAGSRSTS